MRLQCSRGRVIHSTIHKVVGLESMSWRNEHIMGPLMGREESGLLVIAEIERRERIQSWHCARSANCRPPIYSHSLRSISFTGWCQSTATLIGCNLMSEGCLRLVSGCRCGRCNSFRFDH